MNPVGLTESTKCLSRITDLELYLLYEEEVAGQAQNEYSIERDLVEGMVHLKRVRRLRLCFPGPDDMSFILKRLGSTVCLTCLESVKLEGVICEVPALSAFLRPHARTLRSFTLCNASFLDSDRQIERFRQLLEELRDCFNLTLLQISSIETLKYLLSFSDMYFVGAEEWVNEDGYIDIWSDREAVELRSDDIKEGISNVLRYLIWTVGS